LEQKLAEEQQAVSILIFKLRSEEEDGGQVAYSAYLDLEKRGLENTHIHIVIGCPISSVPAFSWNVIVITILIVLDDM